MTVLTALATLEVTGLVITFAPQPLEWWLTLPILVLYPMLLPGSAIARQSDSPNIRGDWS
jgi:hypothetical protein